METLHSTHDKYAQKDALYMLHVWYASDTQLYSTLM